MEHAIVVNGDLKSALAAVRSLGEKGVSLAVGAERTSGMALYSRHVTRRFTYPSPKRDRAAFVRAVKAEAVRAGGKPVIFAFSDATWLSLYEHRSELAEHATLMYPPERSVDIAFDKAATHSEARRLGIPVIETYTPERLDELTRLSNNITYPAVVKPRKSLTWHDGEGIFGTASFVYDAEELNATVLALVDRLGEWPLVQPFVEGAEYGVEMLADGGEVRTELTHHRLRSLSPTGGASVLKETVDEGYEVQRMREHARALVRALSWSGPIMVEYKVDRDSATPKLMEINGRFWGSLPLAVTAGADIPYDYYLLATGALSREECVGARAGVITRHFLGDVQHLLRVCCARDRLRARLYPTRKKALRDFLVLPPGTQSDILSWRDPLPALMEPIDALWRKVASH